MHVLAEIPSMHEKIPFKTAYSQANDRERDANQK